MAGEVVAIGSAGEESPPHAGNRTVEAQSNAPLSAIGYLNMAIREWNEEARRCVCTATKAARATYEGNLSRVSGGVAATSFARRHDCFAGGKNLGRAAISAKTLACEAPEIAANFCPERALIAPMADDTPVSLSSDPLRGQRILVVDDVDESRMLLVDFLQRRGCRVYIARDGQDGVQKAQSVRPDLILMDIRMPVCDGMTACRLLKANPATRAIPLIFLTSAALPEERVAGLAAGAVDYVTKPFDFEEVRLRLCIHLKPIAMPSGAPTEGDVNAASSTLDAILYRATRKLLLERLGETPSLVELAAAVGTNARRLNGAFKQCVGVTVFDFLREERMKEARRMLSETALDVQTISRELGYSSAANFSTAFRDRFGLPPSQFRQGSGGNT